MTRSVLEILHPDRVPRGTVRAAVFDFDGTVSTLRCGWERVMGPMMLEFLSPGKTPDAALVEEVRRYIDESTGIQTVYQMQWLSARAEELTGVARDPWFYKDEYNRRLMLSVDGKKRALEEGSADPGDYLVAGSLSFLDALKARGIDLYLASGTDHTDVLREAEVLGAAPYFTEIRGAPARQASCSKEAVLGALFSEKRFTGSELLVVGDGKVEIGLGRQCGAYTLGAATDEETRSGVNPVKRARLVKAGADALTGDFTNADSILRWLDGEI